MRNETKRHTLVISDKERELEKKIDYDVNSIFDGITLTSPLVISFCRSLKKQKVFKDFYHKYRLEKISSSDKRYYLRMGRESSIQIGSLHIPIKGFVERSNLVRRLMVLNMMFRITPYYGDERMDSFLSADRRRYFEAYAKEYFRIHKPKLRHSCIFYQNVFGALFAIIGMTIMSSIVFYFFDTIGVVLFLAFIIYRIIYLYFKIKPLNFLKKIY